MSNIFKRSFLVHSFLMLLIFAGLVVALFSSLSVITKHGQDAKVPLVIGHKLKLAQLELKGFEVQVDSVYMPYKDPLEIIFQEPQAGNIVKKGRVIFLTVNKVSPPTIAMPNLVSMSFRNASFTLQTFRLVMGDTIYKPDIAAGAVLDQLYNGKTITAGTNIAIGSKISLVVGSGLSDSALNVPNLVGMTFASAKSVLAGMNVSFNALWEGTITDSNSAVIYNQAPEAINELDFVNTITAGDMIDLKIMQKPSTELLRINQPGSKKFVNPSDSIPAEAPVTQAQAMPTNSNPEPARPKIIPGMDRPRNLPATNDNEDDSKDDKPAPKKHRVHHTTHNGNTEATKKHNTTAAHHKNTHQAPAVKKQESGGAYKDEYN